MNKIIVIGTQPPCPRCKLLTEIVNIESELMDLDADIKHISYLSEEAVEIAGKISLVPGTAKDVARIMCEEINLERMNDKSQSIDPAFLYNLDPALRPLENLFREVFILDNWLRSYENQARKAGILMTPVLIINGEIKHSGSVPELVRIKGWLAEL